MIRTKGEPDRRRGGGRAPRPDVLGEIRMLQAMPDDELMAYAKGIAAPFELVRQVKQLGRLPVVNFAAGGIATPRTRP